MSKRPATVAITTVPGPNIRNGDFRGTARPILDPATYDAATNTRKPFPTDMVIDPARFNPAAVNVLKFIPPSNDPAGTILANGEALYYSSASRQNDQDSFDVKIDHRFSDKDQFSGRFSFGNSHTVLPGAFSEQSQYAPFIKVYAA